MASIIVVDDEDSVRDLMARILTRAGHDVRSTADGATAAQLHRQRRADLVVTDLFMPEQDGLETMQMLRDVDGGTRILAVSGGAGGRMLDALADAALLGADDVLPKPFTPEELTGAVAKLLAS